MIVMIMKTSWWWWRRWPTWIRERLLLVTRLSDCIWVISSSTMSLKRAALREPDARLVLPASETLVGRCQGLSVGLVGSELGVNGASWSEEEQDEPGRIPQLKAITETFKLQFRFIYFITKQWCKTYITITIRLASIGWLNVHTVKRCQP